MPSSTWTKPAAPVQKTDGSVGAAPFLRTFENEKNSFLLNQADLHFERQADNVPGFVADINFGKTADTVAHATHYSGSPTNLGNGTDFFDPTQFYLTYTIPAGSGIKLKAGRFVTLAGEEVIKAYNNINFNVTNSILFGYAIPFTHTGIMASYAFNDMVGVDVGLVNGWDDVADNNDGKTLHSGISITPDPMLSFYISQTYGAEQPSNGQSKRYLSTLVMTVKPTDQLTFIVDYDYGNESNIQMVSSPTGYTPGTASVVNSNNNTLGPGGSSVHIPGNADWQGVAGYIVFAPTEDWQFALRGEVFDDPDGVRTLVQQAGFGPGATYWEFTPTVVYKIADGLLWRNEYRHDQSDKAVFPHQNSYNTGQDTLATELVYTY